MDGCESGLPLGQREELQEIPDGESALRWVAHGQIRMNLITVLPAVPKAADVSGILQVVKNPLHRALGDAYSRGNLPGRQTALTGDAKQDLSVIGEERPL